eukprot:CAMPEP_0170477916 /NCGR_PEP_ID=MMETSP0123-20130129/19075_1 /TAXON_ID=182087 /ORGANISM="Favella ehrenbergii, Strain Fehren 1" /LENGTH=42 /DNA_ID= /DNA_START= /DNA_END= /DNA_ORIENTATION=
MSTYVQAMRAQAEQQVADNDGEAGNDSERDRLLKEMIEEEGT